MCITNTVKVNNIIPFGGFNWRVLVVRNNEALLITDKLIEVRAYHNTLEDVTWEKCDLRAYLNGKFYNNFSPSEKKLIITKTNTNNDNPCFGTPGGNPTDDKVFLLSIEEVVKYFGDSGHLARKKWENKIYIVDQFNSDRVAMSINGSANCWWLRSPGGKSDHAANVTQDGSIDLYRYLVVGDGPDKGALYAGIRPAIWLKLI